MSVFTYTSNTWWHIHVHVTTERKGTRTCCYKVLTWHRVTRVDKFPARPVSQHNAMWELGMPDSHDINLGNQSQKILTSVIYHNVNLGNQSQKIITSVIYHNVILCNKARNIITSVIYHNVILCNKVRNIITLVIYHNVILCNKVRNIITSVIYHNVNMCNKIGNIITSVIYHNVTVFCLGFFCRARRPAPFSWRPALLKKPKWRPALLSKKKKKYQTHGF